MLSIRLEKCYLKYAKLPGRLLTKKQQECKLYVKKEIHPSHEHYKCAKHSWFQMF